MWFKAMQVRDPLEPDMIFKWNHCSVEHDKSCIGSEEWNSFCVVEVDMKELDEEFIRLLAWQRIQQLLSPKSLQPSNKCGIPPAVTASLPKPSPPADGNEAHPSRHIEAMLLPLQS